MGGAGKGPGIGWSREQPKYSWEGNLYAFIWKILTSRTMSIFSHVCDAKAKDLFNCVLFKCYKFMKERTDSALSHTKYVKCFRVETSCYRVYFDWNSSWLWNYCTIKRKVILSNVKQKFNWNRIVHQNALQWLYGVWSSLQPDHETNKPSALQPGTITGRRSETFEDLISFLFRG